jgi:nucleoside-diphosphate-sugar epimerase
VHWDGEQTRDFTYVGDVARANLLAAKADSRVDGQVINIGAGRAKSVNEVLATISTVMDLWIEPVRMPKRQGDVRSTLADISRAKELLGWEPEADWEEAVAATVGWFTAGKR